MSFLTFCGTGSAFAAGAKDGKVVKVGFETEIAFEMTLQARKCLVVNLLDRLALPTNQMMMVWMAVQFILDPSVSQIGLRNQTQLTQQV